jgi:hypothetical protein
VIFFVVGEEEEGVREREMRAVGEVPHIWI